MIAAGVVLAVLASVAYGLSDVLSGAVVRRHATASLALWAQVTGLVVLAVAAAVRQPALSAPGLAWGAGAGAVGALGLLAFYTALQRGRTSVVAPVAGAGVVLPVLVGVLGGDALGWRSGLGVALAVTGVLVVAAAPDEDEAPADPVVRAARPVPGRTQPVPVYDGCVPPARAGDGRASVALAALAALAFGLFFVVLEQATGRAVVPGAGQQPLDVALVVALAVQAGALVVTLLAATRHTRACLRPERSLVVPATLVGLVDVGADVLVTLAVDRGPLAVVGPLASLDPVVAVLVATLVLRERLRLLPGLGVLGALGGIVLVATG
ncbi:EamA family transporter [Geodermatophilus sp. DSM 44513]|uniref:EamA family transporter n=1 Tax=Geodermatophilus sp. DSM 44513 TaxID=1528104 RepID=UPI001270F2FA|nr:EamA family transporter [Geodermatophilus sp. DSM 44513]WNV73871.1 EamA family transporter [Geodermatophilus sp. DSM 44513]